MAWVDPGVKPLADHAADLRRKFGDRFTLHSAFAQRKALIVDKGLTYSAWKDALARLTGGVWRVVDGKDFLDVDPAVDAWRKRYEQADRDAERVARADVERELTASIRRALDREEDPAEQRDFPALPKILRALDPRLAENAARWLSESLPVDEVGETLERRIPVSLDAVRAVQEGADLLANVGRTSPIAATQIQWSQHTVELQARPRGDVSLAMAVFFDPAPPSIGERRNNLATERMATLPLPPGALLGFDTLAPGARISPELAEKTVRFGALDADAEALVARLPTLRRLVQRNAEQPTRTQLLRRLADAIGLSVVADAYTRTYRLESPSLRVGTLLGTASRAFGCVFLQQGDVLISRHVRWPLDDLAEPPWPLPERWLAAKAEALQRLDAVPNPLILPTMVRDDLAALLALPPRQRGRLQRATDALPIQASHEAHRIGENLSLMRDVLSPGVWRALVGGSVVPVARLSERAQDALRIRRGDSALERGLRLAPFVPGAPDGSRTPALLLAPELTPGEGKVPVVELPIPWPPR